MHKPPFSPAPGAGVHAGASVADAAKQQYPVGAAAILEENRAPSPAGMLAKDGAQSIEADSAGSREE